MSRVPWVLLPLLAACGESSPYGLTTVDGVTESCIDCHRRIQPGLLADFEASPHENVPLACESCHGTDHGQMFQVKGDVPPTVCAKCHEEAYQSFGRSRHGIRLREGKLDAPLASAPLETGSCGATSGCHAIQKTYADGSVGRCGSCHVTRAFRNREAREPRVCIGCHGGSRGAAVPDGGPDRRPRKERGARHRQPDRPADHPGGPGLHPRRRETLTGCTTASVEW